MPWISDVLLSDDSVKAYGRDIRDFVGYMSQLGVHPLHVTADHVKLYGSSEELVGKNGRFGHQGRAPRESEQQTLLLSSGRC